MCLGMRRIVNKKREMSLVRDLWIAACETEVVSGACFIESRPQ